MTGFLASFALTFDKFLWHLLNAVAFFLIYIILTSFLLFKHIILLNWSVPEKLLLNKSIEVWHYYKRRAVFAVQIARIERIERKQESFILNIKLHLVKINIDAVGGMRRFCGYVQCFLGRGDKSGKKYFLFYFRYLNNTKTKFVNVFA